MSPHLRQRHVEARPPAPAITRPVPIGHRLVPAALAGGVPLVVLSATPASA